MLLFSVRLQGAKYKEKGLSQMDSFCIFAIKGPLASCTSAVLFPFFCFQVSFVCFFVFFFFFNEKQDVGSKVEDLNEVFVEEGKNLIWLSLNTGKAKCTVNKRFTDLRWLF